MGIHMLEKLVMDALKSAGVDCKLEKYSAISLRKSMLQSGVDCNVPDLHLSRLAGHKALVSKKAYVNSAGLHHQTTFMFGIFYFYFMLNTVYAGTFLIY